MTDLAAGGPSDTTTISGTVAKRRLSKAELSSWRAFLRAHAVITRTLEVELLAEQELSLAAYDVLVQLVEAPERRLRMTELRRRGAAVAVRASPGSSTGWSGPGWCRAARSRATGAGWPPSSRTRGSRGCARPHGPISGASRGTSPTASTPTTSPRWSGSAVGWPSDPLALGKAVAQLVQLAADEVAGGQLADRDPQRGQLARQVLGVGAVRAARARSSSACTRSRSACRFCASRISGAA